MKTQYSRADLCRASYWIFVKEFWGEVPGVPEMIENWHMSVIAKELQRVADDVFARKKVDHDLLINIPPGTSKSTLCSILFPCWVWTRMPMAKFLMVCHTDQLALDFATKARRVIKGEKYQSYFPGIVLRNDQDTKSYFANTIGGERRAYTVKGKNPMGAHADFQIIDDPIDAQDIMSDVERTNCNNFFTGTLFTRKTQKGKVPTIMIMQRLHREDPSGAMLSFNAANPRLFPLLHYKLPAELPGDVRPPELAKFYKNGLLDPVRMDRDELERTKVKMGTYYYAGQFMQEPTPLGGGMFLGKHFNLRVPYSDIRCRRRVRSWDRASTQDGGCYTAGVLMSVSDEGRYFVEDCVHGRWEPGERNDVILRTAIRDREHYGPHHAPTIKIESEGGSGGKESNLYLARVLAGFPIVFEPVTGSKDVRAEPWAGQVAAGNVVFVDNDRWDLKNYIEEHVNFRPMPDQKKRIRWYCDRVDASSGAFNFLVKARSAGGARLINYDIKKKDTLHFVVCTRDELKGELVDEYQTLLIHIADHHPRRLDRPANALAKILDYVEIVASDVQPVEYQDKWEEPIHPYGKPCRELMMNDDEGKKLWVMMLKKRNPKPQVAFFCSNHPRMSLAVALGVADMLGYKRSTICKLGDLDWKLDEKVVPRELKEINFHAYSIVRRARSMVIG